jgi:dTDP-4-amino-4,6-dideoxygalactose transaminase
VIEDAAQALGSKDEHDIHAGSCGIASMFSFSFNKLIAAGQGGMVVTDRTVVGQRIKYLSLQAKDDENMYLHHEAGFNVGMSNINAALACAQMEQIDEIIKKKRRVRDKYLELLGKEKMYYQERGNAWLNTYKSSEDYITISNRLEKKGIRTRPLFYPNHLQAGFKRYLYFGEDRALKEWQYAVCLPSSPDLTNEEIKYIVQSIRGEF